MKQRTLYTLAILLLAMLTFAQSKVKYEYDEIYRLTRVTYGNGTVVEYTYDALGNRTAKEVTGGSAPIVENAEPYAVLSNNNTLLTFYYDDQKEARGGMEASYYSWRSHSEEIKTVVFDASFDRCSTITNTSYWFKGCENLTSIIGLSYLHTEAVNSMEWMFYNCSGLTSLDVSHFDTRNVTNMFGMFEGCTNLTGLDVSHFNTEKVTNMQQMFSCCYNVKNLDLTNFDTRNVTNMRHMLSFCKSLEELDLRSFNTRKVTDMVCMFRGSSKLKTITVAEDWDMSLVTESEDMFDLCTSLVGGSGTTYSSSHTDNAYAHIDGGADNPGYFTEASLASKLLGDIVIVDGGTFMMGATDGSGFDDERPVHEVTVPTFSISKYEVTQAVWKKVMDGNNPSTFVGDDLPVNNVSWNECQDFVSRLNSMTGLTFSLPTEAEWEFAARGGIYANDRGGDNGYQYAGGYNGIESIDDYVWYKDNSDGTTHAVGTKKPNELGLYDMSGNVCEYADDYWTSAYGEEPENDYRIYRGGSYQRPAWQCRLASRYGNSPDNKREECGLRLVLRKSGGADHPAITLYKDWNWMSHWQQGSMAADAVKPSATRILSQTQELVKDGSYGWVGNLMELLPTQMYKVQTSQTASIALDGSCYDASAGIALQTGWNWISYPYFKAGTPDAVITNAEEGDYISGQRGFAEYADDSWAGTLTVLQPGEGYLYKSVAAKTLAYDFTKADAAAARSPLLLEEPGEAASRRYPSTMNITARISIDGVATATDGYVVCALADGELRGVSRCIGGTHYLTIYGDQAVPLSFLIEEEATGQTFEARESLSFVSDVVGSRRQPFVFTIGAVADRLSSPLLLEGLGEAGAVYTLEGILVSRRATPAVLSQLPKGVYIVGGRKVCIK